MNLLQIILMLGLRVYRSVVSPVFVAIFSPMGLGCRFTPTCSEYALDAIRTHGAMRGTALAARRLCRCHPWGGCGCDPVPTKEMTNDENRMTREIQMTNAQFVAQISKASRQCVERQCR